MKRGATMALEPGLAIQFNDRSATITRYGEAREQPLADPLCRAQVMRVHHTPLVPAAGSPAGLRHLIELVTVQSAWHNGVGQPRAGLAALRGARTRAGSRGRAALAGAGLGLARPALPEPLARGAVFTVRGSGDIDYEIPDTSPRRGTIVSRRAR